MEWTTAAITEVFVTSLVLSSFAIAALIVPLYITGVFYRSLRTMLRRRRREARGFGRGPVVMGRPVRKLGEMRQRTSRRPVAAWPISGAL